MAFAVATTSQLRHLSSLAYNFCYFSELVHALLQINLVAEFQDSWQQKTRTFVNNNYYTCIVHFLLVSSSATSKLVTFSPIYGPRKLRQHFCL
uniref:Uncharacterized protein n=1 Tax=Triticum urartu TaxID=4572 RepID=A0A8R7VFC2_TRIUA